jgi:hypothetical protein
MIRKNEWPAKSLNFYYCFCIHCNRRLQYNRKYNIQLLFEFLGFSEYIVFSFGLCLVFELETEIQILYLLPKTWIKNFFQSFKKYFTVLPNTEQKNFNAKRTFIQNCIIIKKNFKIIKINISGFIQTIIFNKSH